MVRNTLEEGLDTGVGIQVNRGAERLTDDQAVLYDKHGVLGHQELLEDMVLLLVQDMTDTTNRVFQILDLHVNGFPELTARYHAVWRWRRDPVLCCPTLSDIPMQLHIMDVKVYVTHALLIQYLALMAYCKLATMLSLSSQRY